MKEGAFGDPGSEALTRLVVGVGKAGSGSLWVYIGRMILEK